MAVKKKNNTKKLKKKPFFKQLSFILFFLTIITLGSLLFLNVIPTKYFIILTIIFILYDLLMFYLLLINNWKKRIFGTIFSFIKIILMIVILFYVYNTFDFFNKIQSGNYNTENYNIIVLKDSNYENLKDLKGMSVGVLKNPMEGLELAKKHLKKKVNIEYKEVEDLEHLVNSLEKKIVSAILVEDSNKKILEEEYDEFLNIEKVLYQFSVDVPIKDELSKNVDILNTPFNIYISGIDTYGKISSVSRSDVNMVVTVNPQTNEILLTSIPRDYYVKLHGINTTYKDKLTHAGIHGIDTSVKTIEDLLNISINYYIRVNFTSLVAIVDKLGGIDVELDEAFKAYYNEDGKIVNYAFKKGTNHLNGDQALAFVRERKSLANGDVGRVHHQQLVLEGLINKALNKNIIMKYTEILNSLEGRFVTNIGTKNITNLVKKQIEENTTWTFQNYTLEGTNGYEYTNAYKTKKSYVMLPDEESVSIAKDNIYNLINS